jgi:hypothetical protein
MILFSPTRLIPSHHARDAGRLSPQITAASFRIAYLPFLAVVQFDAKSERELRVNSARGLRV